jgi:general secretion pathway protein I
MTTPKKSPDAARSRGFTLIEVLAALVIVALGMLGVIEAVTQSARNGTYLREKTLAHWIAMNVVTERRLQPSAPAIGETSGDVDYAGSRWHWRLRVTQTQLESMRRMDVAVRAASSPEDSSLATLTGFYGTAIGAAGGTPLVWTGVDSGAGAPDPNQDENEPVHPGGKPPRPVRPPVHPPSGED